MLAALLVIAAAASIVWWSTLMAQARAVAVVATLLEVPVVEPIVAGVTRDATQADTRLAGLETRVYRPTGEGAWPGLLFLTGADAAGRESEDVARLGEALARAGYVTIVPELPGLASGAVSDGTLDAAARAVASAPDLPRVRGERVAVGSASAGASLAILAVARPEVAPRVSVVAGVAPFARVETVLQVAVTGAYVARDGRVEQYDSEQWLRTAVAASLFETTSGGAAAEALETRVLEQDDPIAALREIDPSLLPPGDSRAVLELLRSDDPRVFAQRYEQLPPDVRSAIDELSPLRSVAQLQAPLELAASEQDRYFPLEESELLVEAAPDGRLTVTNVLEHARPRPGLGDAGDLLAFNGFVVRVLRAADERSS